MSYRNSVDVIKTKIVEIFEYTMVESKQQLPRSLTVFRDLNFANTDCSQTPPACPASLL